MSPPARCLDITRLVSRQGRGALTGVDRVELAYLRQLLETPVPLFLLARTARHHLLLDAAAARRVLAGVTGGGWGPMDLRGRLALKSHPEKRRAESDLRRLALGRARRGGLAALLARHLPEGTAYLNTGHSNLSAEVLETWAARRGPVSVLVHDAIPLDHPDYQRPGTVESFRARLARVSAHAGRVIYSTETARASVERHFAAMGRAPEALVAPLGIDLPAPDPARLPPGLPPDRPYFVTVGTLEPRKNHALLLDAWDQLARAGEPPVLVIAGRRGWRSEALFRRLDASPLKDRSVIERADLDDAALAALLQGARALLFPSLAEGYGLPPIEAAALQVPVVCTDLPVYREVLGDIPVYLRGNDVYSWKKTIIRLAEHERARTTGAILPPRLPTWTEHFNRVLRLT
jgi:glycosyltransferase involved in cell wall biosynthesis